MVEAKIRTIMRLFIVAVTASIVALSTSSFLTNSAGAAGSASLSFTPLTSSVETGKTIKVDINENSGSEVVNVIEINATYNSTRFEFVGISYDGSAFDIAVSGTGGGGIIQITRGTTSGVSGTKKVASVTFKALTGSGTAQLNFASGSAIVRSSDYANVWNELPSTANYTITEPATSSGTPVSSNQNTNITTPATPSPTSPAVTSGQNIPDDQPVPVIGELDGNTSGGYLVAVQVFDTDGLGVSDVVVTLGDKEATTDSFGIASFASVPVGKYKLSAEGVRSVEVEVLEGNKTEVQNFSLRQSGRNWVTTILMWLVIIGLIAGLIYFIRKKGSRIKGLLTGLFISRKNNNKLNQQQNVVKEPFSTSESTEEDLSKTLDRLKGQEVPRPSETIMPDSKSSKDE